MHPGDEQALVIAGRSRKNLEFVYSAKRSGADVEEFTQLLNSMLGILICLREEYFKGKSVSWEDVEDLGLVPIRIAGDAPDVESQELKHTTSFSQLISKLRHGFAHNCFRVIGKPVISGITIWNVKKDFQKCSYDEQVAHRCWRATLSEQQIKDISYLLIDYLEGAHKREFDKQSWDADGLLGKPK